MNPVETPRYISLILSEDPDLDTVKGWFQSVKSSGPYGVLDTVEAGDDEGSQKAALIKRHDGENFVLTIPVTRDLLEDEVVKIIGSFSARFPSMDFDIEATVVKTGDNGIPMPSINVDQQRYIDLCSALSKKQHEDWVSNRAKEGWRYGPTVSMVEKTHPLIRPWDQLPDRHQTIDMESPKRMIELLNQHGYTVVGRDDLEALFRQINPKYS